MWSFLNVLGKVLILDDVGLLLIILAPFFSSVIANHGFVHFLGLHIVELVKELISFGFGLLLVEVFVSLLFTIFWVLLLGELTVCAGLLEFSFRGLCE
jgi:hypothetical protein